MKRGTPDHPKARALATRLKLKRYEIVGLLESVWHFAAGYAKRGDVGRFSDAEIADNLGWPGDPAELIEALVQSRWLDRCPCHRLRVHHWQDHADQTVTRADDVKRRGFLECYGQEIFPEESAKPALLVSTSVSQSPADLPLPLPSPYPQPVPGPLPAPNGNGNGHAPSWQAVEGPRPNPFVQGKRGPLEREAMELTAKVAELMDLDPPEVFRKAAGYDGARKAGSPNPANLSDDRLLNTVMDLRKMLKQAQDRVADKERRGNV